MIKFIKGRFHPYTTESVIVESDSGVGFEVFIPTNSTIYKTLDGDEVKIYTEMVVKEDGMTLYGFSEADNLGMFRMLIAVNGIGPKAAMSIMSTLSINQLVLAIGNGDAKAISAAPGVGKKTAERVILELKDKVPTLSNGESSVSAGDMKDIAGDFEEALEALISLGYGRNEAFSVLDKVSADCKSPEEYIRRALSQLL